MGRIAEAKEILKNKSSTSIGLAALGQSTLDPNGVIESYTELYQSQMSDGSLPSKEGVLEHAIHGIVLWQIYQDCPDNNEIEIFLAKIFSNLLSFQQYLYNEWCPAENGLIVEESRIDPLINSLFAYANDSVIELGYALNLSSDDLFERNELTLHSMNELLWNDAAGLYQVYDIDSQRQIENHSSSGFLPMIAGAPDIDQVLVMVRRAFGDDFRQEGHYSFPSYNLNLAGLAYHVPDQGAINITSNWLLIQGLLRYDMDDLADVIQEDTIVLLEHHGFFEYFDPRKTLDSNGLKGGKRPNAAAIFLHLLREDL